MSLGDGDKKDIRQRAMEFLEHGVLGCCPETKAALGKTVGDTNTQKQPENRLPNIVNDSGYRYDPNTKYKPGMVLELFPTHQSREALHGQPNFGWIEGDQKPATAEEMAESLRKMLKGPRVVQEVWEVDKDGNPTKLVRTSDKRDMGDESPDGEMEGKGLGRTLREMNPGNTLIARAAKKFGVWIDELGKFRCPPGTPQANQFTDEFGSTCFAVSASQIANAIQEGFASRGGRFRMPRWKNNLPFYYDEWGNPIRNIDVLEGRQDYFRVFNDSKSRVRARIIEMQENVDDLLRISEITESSDDNRDLRALLRKLGVSVEGLSVGQIWSRMSQREKDELAQMGITRQSLEKTERGFLMKYAELGITDPEQLSKISKIQVGTWKDGREASTNLDSETLTGAIKDVKYAVGYDPLRMAFNAATQVEEVLENQRLGMRVLGAASEEEAASMMHGFITNEYIWAGGMTASLGEDRFLAKGIHTGIHEFSHTVQMDLFIEKMVEKYGSSQSISKLANKELLGLMIDIGDGADLDALGLVQSDLDKVAYLGGKYGRDAYAGSGGTNELWKIETSAELYALREMGVIEGDDVDAALSWMDASGTSRSAKMRSAGKKKNRKALEKALTKPLTRDDGRRDHPDSPPPPKPQRPRRVRSAREANSIGTEMREAAIGKLEKHEREALERIGDPRTRQVISLLDPREMSDAVLSIDAGHKFARKYGAELDEIDVSGVSSLSRVAYDPKRKRLYVTFKGLEGKDGRTFYYRNVFPETVLELIKSDKKGKAINDIKRAHDKPVRVDRIPLKVDPKSLDDADIAAQVQFSLIPTLTAMDKSEIGREMRVVIPVGRDKSGNVDISGITAARIYHDGIRVGDDEMVLSLPAYARGVPFVAGDFDRETTGSMTMMMLPPMRVTVLDDASGRRAELHDQEQSDTTLNRIVDQFPSGGDAKTGKVLESSRRKVEQVVASHNAMGEGSGRLPDGSTTPISAKRIRTRNADIHERQKRRRSSPTKPTKQYRDTVVGTGFSSIGKIETPEERSFGRMSSHASVMPGIRNDASVDPEIRRIIGNADDRQISKMIEAAANDFHDGIDRRPRLRVSDEELRKIVSDGGRHYKPSGYYSAAEKAYQALIGIHPDTDDIDRPVSGYVVHPNQDASARNAMRRRGMQVGDAPIEWPNGSNPHGDVDSDGEIEIVLKPEVSGRTAYGFGYGIGERTRPVWMNSSDYSAVADALVHVNADTDADASRARMLNALSAMIDGNYGYFTDTESVKPVATSQNERTEDFLRRAGEQAKSSKPQRLGAHIMGGFVSEEIAEIRYPWSRIAKSASDVDISDVVNKEPVSDRLRRLGFTDEEIEYFYKVNGDRSLDYISSATMSSLREYRKALQVRQEYRDVGIPDVVFAHPAGFDPLDVESYSPNAAPGSNPEDALAKAINEEVDALVEKMLKQVRKTRGKLWEMRPKAGAAA